MKPLVNLAREPFRNRRIFWLSVLLIFGVTSWCGLQAMSEKISLERRLITEDLKLKATQKQFGLVTSTPKDATATKDGKGKDAAAVTITPEENKELIAASDLIERRAFSWSQLLNDIERHIPRNVRVMRVSVNKVNAKLAAKQANGGKAEDERAISLTMEVIGKSTTDVTLMITDFERTGIFTMTPREKKVLEGIEDVQWVLDVEYRPPQVDGFRSSPNTIAEKR
jgi:hypothetical protein